MEHLSRPVNYSSVFPQQDTSITGPDNQGGPESVAKDDLRPACCPPNPVRVSVPASPRRQERGLKASAQAVAGDAGDTVLAVVSARRCSTRLACLTRSASPCRSAAYSGAAMKIV